MFNCYSSLLEGLPEDCQLHMTPFLDWKSHFSLRRVCHEMETLCRFPESWGNDAVVEVPKLWVGDGTTTHTEANITAVVQAMDRTMAGVRCRVTVEMVMKRYYSPARKQEQWEENAMVMDILFRQLGSMNGLRLYTLKDVSKFYKLTDARLQYLTCRPPSLPASPSPSPPPVPSLLLAELEEMNVTKESHLSGDGLQLLALAAPRLLKLNLAYCRQLVDADLAALSGMVSLEVLDLGGCDNITDAGLQHLTSLVNMRELDLSGCKLTGTGLRLLVQSMPRLRKLYLLHCFKLTNADLAALSGMVSLEVLNLQGCHHIADTGLQHLASLASLVNMQELNLSWCKLISGTGLRVLARRMPRLRKLNLWECVQVVDAGLAALSGMVSLEVLKLRGCELITDAGLQHLASLVNLQELNLGKCSLTTQAGRQRLHAALPSLIMVS